MPYFEQVNSVLTKILSEHKPSLYFTVNSYFEESQMSKTYQMHRTADGQNIPICQMDDGHLVNTIFMFCEKMDEQVTIASGSYQPDNELDAMFSNEANPEYARQNARNQFATLEGQVMPYILEATIRNLDVSEAMQIAYRRDKRNRKKSRSSTRFAALRADNKEK